MSDADQRDAETHAPPVVVALVTADAGPWLEECLASIGAQDYPNLSVLVLDTGTRDDTLGRVAAVLPSAYVRRLDGNPGFGPAANEVLAVVEGAAFFAFCHDDVHLDPNAIRILVEEAFRSNAGVVGPKYVSWDEPERLLEVGASVDKAGVRTSFVERGELDQEQHDAVRDVFLIPGGCTLVRADLFTELGGFDPGIDFLGEDLELCWRAQVAGARVVVAPGARVRHREALNQRPPTDDLRTLAVRHRLRAVLTCYGPFHLARVLPQVVVLAVAELLYALVTGRRDRARSDVAAWRWNLARLGELRERRRRLRAVRQFPDGEVRRLQVGGSARLRSYLRGELHAGERLAELGRGLSDSLTSGPRRLAVLAWVAVAVVLLVGTRELVLQRLPVVAGLVPFDESPGALLRSYLSAWREAGVGADAPTPTAIGLLGVAGAALLGATGLLQQLLVLGMLPVGVLGVWRLTRRLASWPGRAAALVVYAVVPLPYDALARGSWGGLLAYGAAPWLVARIVAATDDPPGTRPAGPPPRHRWRPLVALGALTALLAAFVPVAALLVPVVAGGFWLGGLLTGTAARAWPAVPLSLGAVGVAAVLHLPWTFDFVLPDSEWWALGGVTPLAGDPLGVGRLLRFETGPVGVSSLGWGLPLAAALPLLIARDWRFTWAVRCWAVALVCWALAWAAGEDVAGLDLPPADVLLAPAAVTVALAAALGVVAFERDLRGYRFGWRQVVSIVAATGVVLAAVPVAVAAADGRWGLPEDDHTASLSVVREAAEQEGGFRVLWLGHPQVLPAAGFPLDDGLAYAFVDEQLRLGDRWAAPAYGATPLVARALRAAGDGSTARLGRLLAPFGVRFVAVAERAAPEREGTARRPLPDGVLATLAQQLDLRRVDVDPALTVFENTAWAPTRAVLDAGSVAALAGGDPLRSAAGLDLSGAQPGLPERTGPATYEGVVPAGELYVAWSSSSGWELRVDGEAVERRSVGWANAFSVARPGVATLRYDGDPLRWLAIVLQAGLWLAAAVFLVRTRGRAGAEPGEHERAAEPGGGPGRGSALADATVERARLAGAPS